MSLNFRILIFQIVKYKPFNQLALCFTDKKLLIKIHLDYFSFLKQKEFLLLFLDFFFLSLGMCFFSSIIVNILTWINMSENYH